MQMLARMKQDAGAAVAAQRETSPFEEVPPLGDPSSTRRLDSAADDATPRSAGGAAAARKTTQLVSSALAPPVALQIFCRRRRLYQDLPGFLSDRMPAPCHCEFQRHKSRAAAAPQRRRKFPPYIALNLSWRRQEPSYNQVACTNRI